MRSPCSLKQEFLKKWMIGLQRLKKNMSILERKKAIKLSADVAMASLRNDRACWSRALIAKAVNEGNNEKDIVEQIVKKVLPLTTVACKKRIRSKKILKMSCGRRRRCAAQATSRPTSIAKSLVRKRRRILKSLIPGGRVYE
ncbi:Detected protein of unknown function [Hibiscus syriacus]|uniref:IBH1-like N-terminal domain-containing protein n=1 Tax=Hibiscus syriacus TaxID=106335 RepID=A0A6A2Z570_HIBSY|nr:Detected protein of unknown function [Hibiscus syriacus]